MHKFLLAVLMVSFLSSAAFGDTTDLKTAEQIALNYMKFNMSGDYKDAAPLLDPESINKVRSFDLGTRDDALKRGLTEYVKESDTGYTDEEIRSFSPQDYYINVESKMLVKHILQGERGKELLDGMRSSASTLRVVDSKLLSDGSAQVNLQFIDPTFYKPTNDFFILKLRNSLWKVQY